MKDLRADLKRLSEAIEEKSGRLKNLQKRFI